MSADPTQSSSRNGSDTVIDFVAARNQRELCAELARLKLNLDILKKAFEGFASLYAKTLVLPTDFRERNDDLD